MLNSSTTATQAITSFTATLIIHCRWLNTLNWSKLKRHQFSLCQCQEGVAIQCCYYVLEANNILSVRAHGECRQCCSEVSTVCCVSVRCCRSRSTRPCHRSPDWTPLAAGTPSYYVQAAYPHARSGIWICSTVLNWHDGACVSTCWPIPSVLSAQGCLWHAANKYDVWFQIVFVRCTTCMEPTTCRHSPDLHRFELSTFKQHLKTHLFNIAYFY